MTNAMPVRPSLNVTDSQMPKGRDGESVDGDDGVMSYASTEPMEDKREGESASIDDELLDLFGNGASGEGHFDHGEVPDRVRRPAKRIKKSSKRSSEDPFVCPPCGAGERIPKTLTSPIKPSASDVERHGLTHLPYRPWCSACVRAKAREDGHFRGAGQDEDEDGDGLPIVSFDYQELNENEEKPQKVIIGKDEATGNLIAHYVLCKGLTDDWVIRRIVRDLEEIGRRDAIVKTDGEPAITAVQSRLQALRPGRTLPRNPPAYNPESIGPCEMAVQDVTRAAPGIQARPRG